MAGKVSPLFKHLSRHLVGWNLGRKAELTHIFSTERHAVASLEGMHHLHGRAHPNWRLQPPPLLLSPQPVRGVGKGVVTIQCSQCCSWPWNECWFWRGLFHFWNLFFNCYSVTVVPVFPPLPSSAHPIPSSHSQFPHCCPCLWVIYTCSLSSLLFFPPLFPLPLPSGYCQFVLYFNVSACILLACLFCWLHSTYRWDHMVFVFHHLAYFT